MIVDYALCLAFLKKEFSKIIAGADPGFQKGGGGGWQTIFIEGW